jgi:glycosyltransferase involved in cell wall biosynthesis
MLPGIPFFVLAKKMFGCPLVVSEHGSYLREELFQNIGLWQRFILKRNLRHVDAFMAVSNVLQKDIQRSTGIKNVEIVGNPVDTNFFIPMEPAPIAENIRFLHISTLDEKTKNPLGILQSIQILSRKCHQPFKFVIISDEPTQKWEKLAAEMGIEQIVSFIGPSNPAAIREEIQLCSALVMFSVYETFSIVMAEAWSCGKPVISTPVGIAADMPFDVGIKLEDFTPESLGTAMLSIIEGKTFDTKTIRHHALQFSRESFLENISTVYSRAIEKA